MRHSIDLQGLRRNSDVLRRISRGLVEPSHKDLVDILPSLVEAGASLDELRDWFDLPGEDGDYFIVLQIEADDGRTKEYLDIHDNWTVYESGDVDLLADEASAELFGGRPVELIVTALLEDGEIDYLTDSGEI